MPFLGLLHGLVAIGFAVHAMRTGRPSWWLMIILMVPLLGSVAYVLFELLPELAETRRARRVYADLRVLVDPDRDYRERLKRAEMVDSVDTKRALAEECERKGMWEDAIRLYQAAATGVFADDPHLLVSLARAELGAGLAAQAEATLDRLRAANPDFASQEGHLIYARALEAQGRLTEAAAEYEALIQYYAGFEARTRYGLLLQRMGEVAKARALFEAVARAGEARRWTMIPADRDWLKVAKRNLEE